PTLIDITGAEYPHEYKGEHVHRLPGQSILPLLQGEEMVRENPLFFHWRTGSAIRTADWKLVRHEGDWELYDMKVDRTEMKNVAGAQPEVAADLEVLWQEWTERVAVE